MLDISLELSQDNSVIIKRNSKIVEVLSLEGKYNIYDIEKFKEGIMKYNAYLIYLKGEGNIKLAIDLNLEDGYEEVHLYNSSVEIPLKYLDSFKYVYKGQVDKCRESLSLFRSKLKEVNAKIWLSAL